MQIIECSILYRLKSNLNAILAKTGFVFRLLYRFETG